MFSSLVRSQLLSVARVARPVSRSLSALSASRVLPLATRAVASRTFSEFAASNAPRPPTNTVFLANLPWSTTEEDLQELLGEFGAIKRITMPSKDGRPGGFAWIEYENVEQASSAVASGVEEPFHLAGRDLRIDFGGTRHPQRQRPIGNRLFFQNFNGDDDALRATLQEYASQIVSIYRMRDSYTGQALNKGFIEFATIPQASTVIEAFAGNPYVTLSYAYPKRDSGPSGTPMSRFNNNQRDNYQRDNGRRERYTRTREQRDEEED